MPVVNSSSAQFTFIATICISLIGSSGSATEIEASAAALDEALVIDRIVVIGSRRRQLELPGASTYLGPDELEKYEYSDIHAILRQVPGVNIQEEDGWGLRPNIGIRGTGIERSERITLMEDGVLIAPAPYAAPAAYYFPTAGRLHAVEVLKGSSAIKFGPRTTGGAINLVSTPIPDEAGGFVKLRAGSFGLRELHATVGGVMGPVSAVIETFQAGASGFKELPNGGDTGFDIEDYMAKVRLGKDAHWVELKLGRTGQTSNETYLGLTDDDFSANPFQRYAASQNDRFTSIHKQVQATHFFTPAANIDVTTIAYLNTYRRDWFKLDDLDFGDGRGRIRPGTVFADPSDPLNIAALAILRGDADSVDDALQLRHNARKYESYGIQSIVGFQFGTGDAGHDLEIGLRLHKDEEDRLQYRENFKMAAGVMVRTSVDALGSQGNRVGRASALALHVQDEIEWGKWRIIPGLRFEKITLTRTDYAKSDPDRAQGPAKNRRNQLSVLVPGLGVSYQATGDLMVLAGVHRGFSPPGPSDSSASAERSVNYELGMRYDGANVFAEAIGFYSDYSNLLGTCSNATGCVGGDVGDQFNGGAVRVLGLELSLRREFGLGGGVTMPLRLSYTLTDARFSSAFSDGFWGDVSAGDALPYIPRHQLHLSTGLEGRNWALLLAMSTISVTRSRAGSGPVPALERIDARTVFDLSMSYNFSGAVRLLLTAENLFDTAYVVARRPYGARPGKPRAINGGLVVTF